MTKGRLQHTIKHYRDQLAAHEAKAERAIESAYRHTLKTIEPALDRLYTQMVDAMAEGDKIPATWLYEAQRLENLKKTIEQQMGQFGSFTQAQVAASQHYAVVLGEKAATDLLQATVPAGIQYAFGVPSRQAIANMVGALQDGSPLADLFAGFGGDAAQKAGDALVQGIILGNNPRVVARDVQDALDVSRSRALTISRTEMLGSYRDANLETYRANSDVVQKWRWTASPGARTCAMCLAMDGQEFDISVDFESHANCRCVPLPVTNSWADILAGTGVDTSDLEDMSLDMPPASDWFDQQNESIQRQILGNAKYNAYQDGAITLDDLVGQSYSPDWGGSRYEKSLKEALGAKQASKYYANAR